MINKKLINLAIQTQKDNTIQNEVTDKVSNALNNIYKELYRLLSNQINNFLNLPVDTKVDLESYGDRLEYLSTEQDNYICLDEKILLAYNIETNKEPTYKVEYKLNYKLYNT